MRVVDRNLTEREMNTVDALVRHLQSRLGKHLLSVILFGSWARGDPRPDSDIDIAVIVDKANTDMRQLIRHLAVESWLEHGLFVSTRVWDRTQWERMANLRTGLYRNIEREGVQLLPEPSIRGVLRKV
jgi:predicted nucleotidyltransferase